MVQILVLDDHPVVLQGFVQIVKAAGDFDVTGASSLSDGFRIYRRKQPGLIVLDLSFGENVFAGLSFLRRIRIIDPATPILILSMHDDAAIVRQTLNAGANGFVQKDAPPDVLKQACHTLIAGKPFLTPDLATRVVFSNQLNDRPALDALSPREIEILSLIGRGQSYSEIAAALGVSYKAVANTGSNLKSKLAVKSLPELVLKSIQLLK